MEDLKQKPITEEKESLGQKIQKRFIILLGLVILLGLLFSLLSLLRWCYDFFDSFGHSSILDRDRPCHSITKTKSAFFNWCNQQYWQTQLLEQSKMVENRTLDRQYLISTCFNRFYACSSVVRHLLRCLFLTGCFGKSGL